MVKQWLDPRTGVCSDMPGDGLVALEYQVVFGCVRCRQRHMLNGWTGRRVRPFDHNASMVALYYRSYWHDCQLPVYAPTSRDWGQTWRSMLGWLYSSGASREGVVKTWEVFRARRLGWLKHMRLFSEVYEQLYDQHIAEVPGRWTGSRVSGYNSEVGVLVVQGEQIPIDSTWVIDERKFDKTFVRVEGVLHDEEVPLYLVAHIPGDAVTPSMVWVVGRDRHTKMLFTLRVPAQFRYLDSALRWTLRAEPWDRVEEV